MVIAAFKPASSSGTESTTTRYVHTDHLTGSNIVTDSSGNVGEAIDYYPFSTIHGAVGAPDTCGSPAGNRACGRPANRHR